MLHYVPRQMLHRMQTMRLRVQHINTVRNAGGVAFILQAQEQLQPQAGIDFRWDTMQVQDPQFFRVTKKLHNDLHLGTEPLTQADIALYERSCKEAASMLDPDADIIVLHDPQTIGMAPHYQGKAKLVWRLHIEAAHASPQNRRYLAQYYGWVHARSHYSAKHQLLPSGDITPATFNFYPGIDTSHPKNIGTKGVFDLSKIAPLRDAINAGIPTFTQVSRFDPIKQPWGCLWFLKAYVQRYGEARMAFVGAACGDSPDGDAMVERLQQAIEDIPECRGRAYVVQTDNEDHSTPYEYQANSTAMFQNSKREGFGLVVAEALWKGTPVLGRVGAAGIEHQLTTVGQPGWLYGPRTLSDGFQSRVADTMHDLRLLRENPDYADNLKHCLRTAVRANFTSFLELRDWLNLYDFVLRNGSGLRNA